MDGFHFAPAIALAKATEKTAKARRKAAARRFRPLPQWNHLAQPAAKRCPRRCSPHSTKILARAATVARWLAESSAHRVAAKLLSRRLSRRSRPNPHRHSANDARDALDFPHERCAASAPIQRDDWTGAKRFPVANPRARQRKKHGARQKARCSRPSRWARFAVRPTAFAQRIEYSILRSCLQPPQQPRSTLQRLVPQYSMPSRLNFRQHLAHSLMSRCWKSRRSSLCRSSRHLHFPSRLQHLTGCSAARQAQKHC